MKCVLKKFIRLWFLLEETVRKNSEIYNFTKWATSTNNTEMRAATSCGDLEKQAMEQYRGSDESLEEKFKALENEAADQCS